MFQVIFIKSNFHRDWCFSIGIIHFQVFLNILFAAKKKIWINVWKMEAENNVPFSEIYLYIMLNTCCIQFQDRKQGFPQHSSPPCRLTAGKHALVHARDLTSFYLLVLLSNSKPSYHRNILTTLDSIGIPSPICFISLPASTSNYLEYCVCRKPPKENSIAARQIFLSGETQRN